MIIFHVKDGENGATYKFWDKEGNLLKHDINSLSEMVRYQIEGVPEWDKFFALPDKVNIAYPYSWGFCSKETHATGEEIGCGKSNTKRLIALNRLMNEDCVFKYVEELNTQEYEGYNDWYIPSIAEFDALTNSIRASMAVNEALEKADKKCMLWTSTESAINPLHTAYALNAENKKVEYPQPSHKSNDELNGTVYGCTVVRSF